MPSQPSFAVTASFVGKRNYTTEEIKINTASGLMAASQYKYSEYDKDADINIRVFIEHEDAYIGMRLAEKPLHIRPYKSDSVPGTLKPPIAAAMAQIAKIKKKDKILDPFCGSGTILMEASKFTTNMQGGDINPEVINIARENLSSAGIPISIDIWDATSLPLKDNSVDKIITNLPWDKQTKVKSPNSFYKKVSQEMERILSPKGNIIILTDKPELINFENSRYYGA